MIFALLSGIASYAFGKIYYPDKLSREDFSDFYFRFILSSAMGLLLAFPVEAIKSYFVKSDSDDRWIISQRKKSRFSAFPVTHLMTHSIFNHYQSPIAWKCSL